MSERPLCYDVFAGAGGAGMGYHQAGFRVVGIDHRPQPRYPFDFIRMDAFDFFDAVERGEYPLPDLWHASPPCQAYTSLRGRWPDRAYVDLLADTRDRLVGSGVPWVIENVPGAPMRADYLLCGAMFGLRSYRHRLFEVSWPVLLQPPHPRHVVRVTHRKVNRRAHWDAGGFATVVGDIGSYVGPEAMGIDWMTGTELSQAIPPAYTKWIGEQALRVIQSNQEAVA